VPIFIRSISMVILLCISEHNQIDLKLLYLLKKTVHKIAKKYFLIRTLLELARYTWRNTTSLGMLLW